MPKQPSRPRLAQRRRARRRILLSAAAVTVLLLVGAAAWFSYHPKVTIHSIKIEGMKEASEEKIRTTAVEVLDDSRWHVLSRRSVFWYPKAEIRDALFAAIPRLELIHMETDGFWKRPELVIIVAEREPVAIWCRVTGSPCYLLDASGFIFAEVPSVEPIGSARFLGGFVSSQDPIGQYFLPTQFERVQQLLRSLRDAGFEPESFLVSNEYDYDIAFSSGLHVYASFEQHPEVIVSNLQTALSSDALRGKDSEIEYVDLRFGNRVYFRLKDGTSNE